MRIHLISILFFIALFSWGQEENFSYSTLDINKEIGLKSKECYFITKDSKDNLWVCTDLGVYKYDCFNTKHYSINDGLLSNVVFEIYEDYRGRIWFLTKSTQLCYLENDSIQPYIFNNEILKFCKYPTSDRKKLIVTPKNLYYSVDRCGYFTINQKGVISPSKNPLGHITIGVLEDSLITVGYKSTKRSMEDVLEDGILYSSLYTNIKGKIQNEIADSIERHKKFDLKHLKFKDNQLEGLSILGGALYQFPSQTFLFRSATSFYPDPLQTNAVWIGTSNGFFHASINNGKLTKTSNSHSFKEHFITSIYVDEQGNTWVSSLENGVIFVPKQRIKRLQVNDYLESSENIRDFCYFKDDLFISTKKHIINVSENDHLAGRYSLLQNYKDSILIITNLNPNNIFSPEVRKDFKPTYFTRDLLLKDDRLYTASYIAGYLNPKTLESHVIYQSSLDSIRDLHLIKLLAVKDTIFVSSTTTLFKLNNQGLSIAYELKEKEITDLVFIPKVGIIISTKSNGLYKLCNNKLELYNADIFKDKPQNISTLYYSEKHNLLFIGGFQGLTVYDLRSKNTLKLNKNQGFINAKISIIKELHDSFFIASDNELFQISSEEIKQLINLKNPSTLPLSTFTSILEDGKTIDHAFELSYFADFITLNFSIKDYKVWKDRKYQYRLNPKGEWITLLSPQIVLPNPRKNFQAQIRYLQNNDSWSNIVLEQQFFIIPPFYKTLWFYLLCTVTIFTLTLLYIRKKMNRKFEKMKMENNLLSYQQRLQNVRIKPHFIFNVLNSINSHILFNELKEASNYLIKFSHLMRNLLEKSGGTSILLEDEKQLLHTYLALEQVRKENKFDFEINLPKELKTLSIPNMMLQPFVENAVIHGGKENNAKDFISVDFKRLDEYTLHIIIFNTGTMSSEQKEKWYLFENDHATGITRDRLASFGSLYKNKELHLRLVSSTKGTEVHINIPILKTS